LPIPSPRLPSILALQNICPDLYGIDPRYLFKPGFHFEGVMMALVGILVGNVGLDLVMPCRVHFRDHGARGWSGIVPLVMGLFGISEVLGNLDQSLDQRKSFKHRIRNLWPSLKDWAEAKWAIVRGSIIGFFLGILPGGGLFSLPSSPTR